MSAGPEGAQGRVAPFLAAILLLIPIPVLAVLAAWPIYETGQLWIVAGVGAALALCGVRIGTRRRWGSLTLALLAALLLAAVLPLGVPGALAGGPREWLRGFGDGVAAIALGWKQLLTLSLPLGSYQTVLVPFLVVVFVSVAVAAALMLRGGRWAPLAGIGVVLPVLFGTVFGSSAVSAPLRAGGLSIAAPRELALWIAAFGAAATWVAWSSGRKRRAALRRGRLADAALDTPSPQPAGADGPGPGAPPAARSLSGRRAVRRNSLVRGTIGALTVVAALGAALVVAPIATQGPRTVPRDVIDPELVVSERVSPLAAYRGWKRDDAFSSELFAVSTASGAADPLPPRLRLAVLPEYDGVDFTAGSGTQAGRFARFPSGGPVPAPTQVSVEIREGYADVWVPIAPPLAAPPQFSGPRASALADSFYLNRETGSAVAVPTARGMREGDGFSVTMDASDDAVLDRTPSTETPRLDADAFPELLRWLQLQQLPNSGDGLTTAVERLRERGYLSHSLTDGDGENLWLRELSAEHGTRFVSSAGGHSAARLEQLFAELSEQQLAAGDGSTAAMLVAGIGDDEQFAAAAALIAQAMGFDSRVVVGVRLGGTDAGVPGVPACSEVCTGEHIAAWVEAAGADGVWAPLDVSPQIAIPPTLLQKGEQLPEFPTQPEDRDASESDPPVGMTDHDSGEVSETEPGRLDALWPVLRVIGLSLLGVLLLAMLLLFVPVTKRLRLRARRGLTTPEARALAAWDELLDAYRDSGRRPVAASRTDLMRELEVADGDWIAWTVDQAVYSHEGISEETAATLWEIVDARIAEQWDDRSVWQRARARFSFASFGSVTWATGRDALRRRGQKEAPE
ncbi:transglutaminase domain-containing protein [Leucobacter sp. BZR 635]